MVTKWKNKVRIAVLGLLVTFAISLIMFLVGNGSYYMQKDYFHTAEFQYEVDEFVQYLSTFELYEVTLEEAKQAITVSEQEITDHRYMYGSLSDQLDTITMQYEDLIAEALAIENQELADTYSAERDTKKADITKNFESDAYVEEKVIKEKEQLIEDAFQEVENYRNDLVEYKKIFTYAFEGNQTGDFYTNLSSTNEDPALTDINEKNMVYLTDYQIEDNYNYGAFYPSFYDQEETAEAFGLNETFTGRIGISKYLPSSNQFISKAENYKSEQIKFWIAVAAIILALFLSYYLAKRVRIRNKWWSYYNKLPIDVRTVIFGLAGLTAVFTTFFIVDDFYLIYESLIESRLLWLAEVSIASVCWSFTIMQGKYLYKSVDNSQKIKQEWGKSLAKRWIKAIQVGMHRMRKSLREAFLNQTIGIQAMLVLGVVFLLGFSIILTAYHPIFLLLTVIIGLPLAIRLVGQIGYFNRIVAKINDLVNGKLGQDLDVTGNSVFAKLASNINLLKSGFKSSQNEQAKSERLKTELITNVSHDLRTPLTSIITYTELLKSEEISSDDRKAYVEIIDRKSQRLKVLIDDLFEVSKMASGNIKLVLEKVDLVQLLQQALAEYDDAINHSSLQFRVPKLDEPVYSLVDGQKLWRVFDNLIGNILKYSLENSRVYIQLTQEGNKAVITFKNVSKFELNENSEELFERFKRGDTSRHTEGTGLGLAIAQSIVDLHNGKLEVDTDGDLFKVTIILGIEDGARQDVYN